MGRNPQWGNFLKPLLFVVDTMWQISSAIGHGQNTLHQFIHSEKSMWYGSVSSSQRQWSSSWWNKSFNRKLVVTQLKKFGKAHLVTKSPDEAQKNSYLDTFLALTGWSYIPWVETIGKCFEVTPAITDSCFYGIDHFTVVCSVTWPLDGSEVGVDLVLIQTSLLLSYKTSCSDAN